MVAGHYFNFRCFLLPIPQGMSESIITRRKPGQSSSKRLQPRLPLSEPKSGRDHHRKSRTTPAPQPDHPPIPGLCVCSGNECWRRPLTACSTAGVCAGGGGGPDNGSGEGGGGLRHNKCPPSYPKKQCPSICSPDKTCHY